MKNFKNFIAAFMGTALEFYDFALYGFFATTISRLFFPSSNPFVALIASYSIFAAGFIMRPLGGIVFGYIGDRLGRKKAMLFSIIVMMIPTSLMGLMPTYEQIGIFAPIILALCRLLQGLCAGGEFSGAAIFVIEHAYPGKKIFSGSLVTASSVVGMLLASTFASYFSQEGMLGWAWRIPFLFSIIIGVVGIYIRKYATETEAFIKEQAISPKPIPLMTLFKNEKLPLLITFSVGAFIGVLYYVPFVFMGHYLKLVTILSPSEILVLITYGLLLYMLCIGNAGYWADKIGPQKIMGTVSFLSLIFGLPALWLIQQGTYTYVLIGILVLSALAGTFVGPANGLTASLFPVKERCRGVSFSLSLGISLFGGLTPIVLTFLLEKTSNFYIPAYWLMLGASFGGSAILLSLKKYQAFTAMAPMPSRPSN